MTGFLDRLRTRLLRPLLEARAETIDALEGQQIAYDLGFASGERVGSDRILNAIEQVVHERRGFEITQADVDAVRKAVLH